MTASHESEGMWEAADAAHFKVSSWNSLQLRKIMNKMMWYDSK
jgi:hypothetical protein